MLFADNIIAFNAGLSLDRVTLPEGIRAMNPFRQAEGNVNQVAERFYHKFYSDNHSRRIMLGINPGRFGAGATGVPFTDTKRMEARCGIKVNGLHTHEPSSVFVYDMIEAFGGPESFYSQIYITSLSPLGFVKQNERGREVNYNFYDQKDLQEAVTPFIVDSLRKQIAFGIDTSVVYLLGTGKNYKFFKKLNEQHHFFRQIVPLEHPRYIIQYKSRSKDAYIAKYLQAIGLEY